MTRNRVSAVLAGAAMVAGSTVALASPAIASVENPYDPDFVPNATDIVGVGSDTIQTVMSDIAAAYNQGRSSGRIASFAADGTPASIVLRSGAEAITRPASSGKGKDRLHGASNDANVSFARSSGTLSDAEKVDGLLQAPFAIDGLQVAVSRNSHAPASLTRAQILKIFTGEVTNWSQVGGQNGVIKPYVPYSGSGTRSFFEAQLKEENGNNAAVLKAAETQEHSPTVLESDPDAIAPFSTARGTVGAAADKVTLLGGWKAVRPVYNVFRSGDLNATTSPALSATLKGIFGEDGFICSDAGRTVIEEAGFEQLASTENGGVCGEFGTTAPANLKTSGQADADTTTALAVTAPGGGKVTLKATVRTTGGANAAGKVDFHEGDDKVGTAFLSGGVATLTLSNVAVGTHLYTATFVPTSADYVTSVSTQQQVKVLTPTTVAITGGGGAYGVAKTVTVTARQGSAPATGAVKVKVGAGAERSYPLSVGVARVPVAATTPAGALTIVASLPATAEADAATATVRVAIAKAKAKASAKAKKARIKASQRGSVVVTVAGASGVKATGKVTVKSGRKVVGTATLRNGKATIKLAKLKKGTYKLVATYAGNANVSGVSAKAVKLKVTK